MHFIVIVASLALGVVVSMLYSRLVVAPITRKAGKPAGTIASLLFIAAALTIVVTLAN